MLKKNRARLLSYAIAILTAFVLAVMGIGHDISAQRQPDSVLGILLAAMAFGILVSAYGLYVERHSIRALVLRHAQVQRRLARRKPHLGPPAIAMRAAKSIPVFAKPAIVAISADNAVGFSKTKRRGGVAASEAFATQLQVSLRGQG